MTARHNPSAEFWAGRRVLLTGHTGFKGAWLALWLQRLGARVAGLSLAPATRPSLFAETALEGLVDHHLCDIRDVDATRNVVHAAEPEVVLHLAAQALVRPGYRDPTGTYATNVMGTAHVLDALRGLPSVRVAIVVTTDKVYRNLEHAYPYREDDALGGHDPYSASKAAAEMVIASYRQSYLAERGVNVVAARAGNVIGGGDWSDERLLPDAMRAWDRRDVLHVRRPRAVRPWQHVLEPLSGYLLLAEAAWQGTLRSSEYNLGPASHEAATVREVVGLAQSQYGADARVAWSDETEGPHEAGLLTLETARVRAELAYRPRWDIEQSVARTVAWHLAWRAGKSAASLCTADIGDFETWT